MDKSSFYINYEILTTLLVYLTLLPLRSRKLAQMLIYKQMLLLPFTFEAENTCSNSSKRYFSVLYLDRFFFGMNLTVHLLAVKILN